MSERRPIRVMPPDLVLKIGAGEVVERPASAVKELIDNAIDAGATQVHIEIRDAGLKLIRVADNGWGIGRDELPLAFTSHATSKVAVADDLERLTTLGFRGEALPSIAAISRVDVQTRTEDEPAGTRLRLEFGAVVSQQGCGAPRGTRIAVFDLFASVPARRKFVRSLRAESGQIQSVVTQYALARPAIQFTLVVDGRLAFESPGSGQLSDALAAVYGPDDLAATLPVVAEDRAIRVEGLISVPGRTRANRAAIHLFVNGRPIQNRSLVFALEEAYSGFLMTGRHPLAAVHLRLAPEDIDPNVHPAKSEIRFAREREVHGVLHRAVATALIDLRLAERDIDVHQAIDAPLPAQGSALPLPVGEEDGAAGEGPGLLPPIPALRVFGQTNLTFIIAEGPRGLYMIDQHAAHERILFDQLDAQLAGGGVASQPLLEPASLDLTPADMQVLEENRELLARVGFVLEPFGHDACLIRAVPVLAGRAAPVDLTREVLAELQSLPEPGAARERALAAMACKAAVKAGQSLAVDEMRELVVQLERTVRPATCPHGRPTMIHLSHTQLEREFGRR